MPDANADSPIYFALNMSKIANEPESFETMQKVGPKVCITTATHPGFVGFQANYQTGMLPLAGRYGGGSVDMQDELNPIRNYQYTMWEEWQDHDDFHDKQFDRVFELCGGCLSMVIEGPWEPVYTLVASDMPTVRSMGNIGGLFEDIQKGEQPAFATPERCVAIAEHTVKPGHEKEFEQGAIETMEALSENSAGFLGYMLLKQMGVCALGSFMLDARSSAQSLQTLGANPPDDPQPAFETPEANPSPPEYLIHSEWDAVELARLGFGKVLVNHRIRQVHDEGVMNHLVRGPYIMFFQPMMEEPSWRGLIE